MDIQCDFPLTKTTGTANGHVDEDRNQHRNRGRYRNRESISSFELPMPDSDCDPDLDPDSDADPDDSVKAAMSGSQPKAHGFAGGCLLDGFSAQNYDPAAPTRYEIL